MMTPAELERQQQIAEEEALEQGLPAKIEDPAALGRILAAMSATPANAL